MKKGCDIKVEAFKRKAAGARGEIKAAMDARVTEIRKDYQQTLTKLKNLEAERLEKTAKPPEKS